MPGLHRHNEVRYVSLWQAVWLIFRGIYRHYTDIEVFSGYGICCWIQHSKLLALHFAADRRRRCIHARRAGAHPPQHARNLPPPPNADIQYCYFRSSSAHERKAIS